MKQFGKDAFQQVFVRHMREAFSAFKAGNRSRLNPKRVNQPATFWGRYRYPPRVFARRMIDSFESGMSFDFQYRTTADKNFGLSQIDNWKSNRSLEKFHSTSGSEYPVIACLYECDKVVRALLKIAVNLLAAYCPNTPVNRLGFGRVIRVITGEEKTHPALIRDNGFVHSRDVEALSLPDGSHSFRLVYANGSWRVWSSFFGGRIGSFVSFPGRNHENWSWADIRAPLKSRDWRINTSRLWPPPMGRRIQWTNPSEFMPSIPILNLQSRLVEHVNRGLS